MADDFKPLYPGDILTFLKEEARPLQPVMTPLFFERQITAWASEPNGGKTSMAKLLSFLGVFKIRNPYFESAGDFAVSWVYPEASNTMGMAIRALQIAHGITDSELLSRFHFISARSPQNEGRVNSANSDFARIIADDIKQAKHLSAPVKLIVLDGFLFLNDEDSKDDKAMTAIVRNVQSLAEHHGLDAAILILANKLKGGTDSRGAQSLKDLVDNFYMIERKKNSNVRLVKYIEGDSRYKRRIPYQPGFRFDMQTMTNPNDDSDIWEYARILGAIHDDSKAEPVSTKTNKKRITEAEKRLNVAKIMQAEKNLSEQELRTALIEEFGGGETAKRYARDAIAKLKAENLI